MELRDIYAITDAELTKYDSQFNFAANHVTYAGRGLLYYAYITSSAAILLRYFKKTVMFYILSNHCIANILTF